MAKWVKMFFAGLVTGGLLVAPLVPFAMDTPEEVELDALANVYEPVVFDHSMHMLMSSCATCHHHTTGMPAEDPECLRCHATAAEVDEVGCTGCHAINAADREKTKEAQAVNPYHTDPTGLKRAYHVRCLGCHREMEAASGCEDCHYKRDVELKVSQAEE